MPTFTKGKRELKEGKTKHTDMKQIENNIYSTLKHSQNV